MSGKKQKFFGSVFWNIIILKALPTIPIESTLTGFFFLGEGKFFVLHNVNVILSFFFKIFSSLNDKFYICRIWAFYN